MLHLQKQITWLAGVIVAFAPAAMATAQNPPTPPAPPAPPSATIPNPGQPQFSATPVIVMNSPNGQAGATAAGGANSGIPGASVLIVPTAAQQPTQNSSSTSAAIVVPAGTKVLLSLKSAVNTRSARVGDGVYLQSSFPVVVNNQVVIPAGAYVQGQIDAVKPAGRMYHRAEVRMHFTTMILQNGSVVAIPGSLHDIPGQSDGRMKDNEGTVQANGKKGKDAGTIAQTTAAGAGIGTMAGAASGQAGRGLLLGGVAGAAAGLAYSMFTRSNEVAIPQGTAVEMVLQRPLVLEPNQVASQPSQGTTPVIYGAAPNQPQPMKKPPSVHPILCPDGSLGCR